MKNNDYSNKLTKIIIFCSIIIAGLSLFILLNNDLVDKPLAGQGGDVSDGARIGGSFTLTDQMGNKFTDKDLLGKVTLIYFGFTFCPDICPTSLQKISEVINTLEKYGMDILPIFVTVDPKRDTQNLMKEYLEHFNGKIIGLTGSQDQVRNVTNLYKVYYAVAENHDKNDDKYMLDHSSFIYLMGRDGKYIKHFYMSNTAKEIIEYIRVNYKTL